MNKFVIVVCGGFKFVQAYGDPVNFKTFHVTENPAEATVYNREQAYKVAKRLGSFYYQPMRAY